MDFFDSVSIGKPSINQSGAGRRPRVITVDQSKDGSKSVVIKAVLPAEQTVAQAKSELEREDINPAAITDMIQKGSSRGRKRKQRSTFSREVKKQRGAGKRRKRKQHRGRGK